jgi:LmbE family N-acetylglucosaminyl deacetylase
MSATGGALLGIWAHPDDEAYLTAGLMAQARTAGRRVVVVTATRGEHGTDDPRTWPPGRLAPRREQELAASLGVLGVDEHVWLGYVDGSLSTADRRLGVATVHRLIADIAPDTVVTFGPEGMTGHDDHRTISSWVTEAWLAGSPAALWYATLTPGFHDAWGPLNERVGLWLDGSEPPATRREDLVAEVVCAGPLLDLKHRALRAHASQTRSLEELVGEETYRRWWATESFVEMTRTGARVGRARPGSSYAGQAGLRPPASA